MFARRAFDEPARLRPSFAARRPVSTLCRFVFGDRLRRVRRYSRRVSRSVASCTPHTATESPNARVMRLNAFLARVADVTSSLQDEEKMSKKRRFACRLVSRCARESANPRRVLVRDVRRATLASRATERTRRDARGRRAMRFARRELATSRAQMRRRGVSKKFIIPAFASTSRA